MASSPVIVNDRVILNLDHDTGSFLVAFDKSTGKEIWKVDRGEFPRGYATPVIWMVDGEAQVVVPGTPRVIGYRLGDGKELWTVRGLARIANMAPVIGPDNTLYLATWGPGAEANDLVRPPAWEDILPRHDKNKNGTLEADEVRDISAISSRFPQIDRDKDGHVARMRTMPKSSQRLSTQVVRSSGVMAIPTATSSGCTDIIFALLNSF